jgi:hypothetical protein
MLIVEMQYGKETFSMFSYRLKRRHAGKELLHADAVIKEQHCDDLFITFNHAFLHRTLAKTAMVDPLPPAETGLDGGTLTSCWGSLGANRLPA